MNESGNVLAFIGDAVLSLQVRTYLVELGITNLSKLQKLSTQFVSASSQATFMTYLLDEKLLSETEILIYKRGRNAKSRSIAKNADVITYRISTGFEAMWGFLHLSHETDRLNQLWELFKERVEL